MKEFKIFLNNETIATLKLDKDGQTFNYKVLDGDVETMRVVFNMLGIVIDELEEREEKGD